VKEVTFQRIGVSEIDQLRAIAIRTFTHSYAHLNTPANFEHYVNKAFAKHQLYEELRNVESFFYLLNYGATTAGYLKLNIGESQTEMMGQAYMEIERLYLEVAYQRRGIGQTMIEFALDKAKSLDKTKVWLGVWDQNPRAIRFYEKMGFQKTGSHIFTFGAEDQTDIIMEIEV